MNVEYTGRQTTVTKTLKAQAESGLERIAKLVGKSASAHVILTTDKYRKIAEVTVVARGQDLVAACEGTEMESALHDALNKIEQQVVRHKQKRMAIKRHPRTSRLALDGLAELSEEAPAKAPAKAAATKKSVGRKAVPMVVHSFPSEAPLRELHVSKSADGVARRPMTLEEAVKEAAFRDKDVFVFRDPAGLAMVLHRKRDGKMELIEVP